MIFQTVFILKKDLFLKNYLVLSSPNKKNVKILSHLPKAAISDLSYALQKKIGGFSSTHILFISLHACMEENERERLSLSLSIYLSLFLSVYSYRYSATRIYGGE